MGVLKKVFGIKKKKDVDKVEKTKPPKYKGTSGSKIVRFKKILEEESKSAVGLKSLNLIDSYKTRIKFEELFPKDQAKVTELRKQRADIAKEIDKDYTQLSEDIIHNKSPIGECRDYWTIIYIIFAKLLPIILTLIDHFIMKKDRADFEKVSKIVITNVEKLEKTTNQILALSTKKASIGIIYRVYNAALKRGRMDEYRFWHEPDFERDYSKADEIFSKYESAVEKLEEIEDEDMPDALRKEIKSVLKFIERVNKASSGYHTARKTYHVLFRRLNHFRTLGIEIDKIFASAASLPVEHELRRQSEMFRNQEVGFWHLSLKYNPDIWWMGK